MLRVQYLLYLFFSRGSCVVAAVCVVILVLVECVVSGVCVVFVVFVVLVVRASSNVF